jgi:hypothetical protein
MGIEEKIKKLQKVLRIYLLFFKNWRQVTVTDLGESIEIKWFDSKKPRFLFDCFESKEFPKEDIDKVITNYKGKINYWFKKRNNGK